jgi:hypothetical protein
MHTIVATPDPQDASLRWFRLTTNAATTCATVHFTIPVPYAVTSPCPGAAPAPLITTWKA